VEVIYQTLVTAEQLNLSWLKPRDATHIEARDQAPQKEESKAEGPVKEPKKRGRKKKEDVESWKKEQEEIKKRTSSFSTEN
jgi:hypothetical protein